MENSQTNAVFRGDNFSKDGKLFDCKGNYLALGFIDIHNHGTYAASFFASDKDEQEKAARIMTDFGTVTVLPASVSAV